MPEVTQNEKELFISFVLNSPDLSTKDREAVLKLVIKEINKDIKAGVRQMVKDEVASNIEAILGASDSVPKLVDDARNSKEQPERVDTRPMVPGYDMSQPRPADTWIHDPKKVCEFLTHFSSDKSDLKYAAHDWEKGDFNGWDYNTFIKRIKDCIKNEKMFSEMYRYNIRLNYALKDYLTTQEGDESKFMWDETGMIKIGLQYPKGCAAAWMARNEGKSLWAMELSAFPEKSRPKGLFDGKQLANMGNVRDVFKHVIEFRDNDFYKTVKQAFDNSDIDLKFCSEPDIFRSKQFYADTVAVKNAFSLFAENIRQKPDTSKDVRISIVENDHDSFELHILHVGSYADRRITDDKILNGTMASYGKHRKDSLMGVCDFAVISRFMDDEGQLKPYRIDYLYPGMRSDDKENSEPRVSIHDTEAEGFEYILRFYTNVKKDTNN